MDDKKKKFYTIIKARSDENEKALALLLEARCYALIGGIIRMELDSLVRVHYFNNTDSKEQNLLLDKFFMGSKWPNTDRNMVNYLASSLGGAEHIYDFCCAFIHLSPYHDWASLSDVPSLTIAKRHSIVNEIKEQQNDVWGYDTKLNINDDFKFDDLLLFAPHIFKKLRGNLMLELNS